MKSDIHQLALGSLELLTKQVEKDTNTSEIWNDLKPIAEEMVKDVIPNKIVEVHPLLGAAFKIGMKVRDRQKFKEIE